MKEATTKLKSYQPETASPLRRVRVGRPKSIESPEWLAEQANNYFEYVENNPLFEAKTVSVSKTTKDKEKQVRNSEYQLVGIPKTRAMTIEGFCIFAGISRETLNEYGKKPQFSDIIKEIKDVISNQQFEAAAAGFLNPNIVSMKLGLRAKADLTVREEQPIFSDDDADEL